MSIEIKSVLYAKNCYDDYKRYHGGSGFELNSFAIYIIHCLSSNGEIDQIEFFKTLLTINKNFIVFVYKQSELKKQLGVYLNQEAKDWLEKMSILI